ncbi:hypothetical protein [Bacillus sp. AFS040349]|uniref:hypothetical protein n=1 Tax=Bacillus sp. AFS040349 TaxID=2033502 RepID=UPI0021003CC9|nr:hypothetical protein [Bacillus sp. AFS040349]
MMHAFTKKSWISFFILLSLIIAANTMLYRVEFMKPLPNGVALGSLFDFIIVIPLLAYFFIIRKRYSLKYLLPVALAGYGIAYLVVPNGLLSSYSFVKYLLFAGEGALLLLELYIVYKLITKIPAILKRVKTHQTEIPTLQYRIEQSIYQELRPSRFLSIIVSELSMFYFSLCTWRKKSLSISNNHEMFSYHKKSSSMAFNIMLIHALILESVGFHFLLHSWNEIVAIISLVLNVYTLFFLVAEIHAIRLTPFIISDRLMSLQVGLAKQLIVPLEEIKSIRYYDGPEKLSKEEREKVFDAVLSDFMKEKPIFEIEFTCEQEARFMYGFKRKVKKVHLSPDEPERFYQALMSKIEA